MATSRPDQSNRALTASRSDLLRLCCAICSGDTDQVQQLVRSRGPHLDWMALIDVAKSHRLQMLLHRAVASLDDALVSRPARAALDALYAGNRAQCERVSGELARLIDRLTSEQLRVMAYKGPVLAAQLYGDPALRLYADLDLLIHEADLDAVRRVMLELGYEAGLLLSWEIAFTKPTGESVDLHWSLAEKIHQFPRTTDELWARRTTVDLPGVSVATFCEEDTLLAVCFNGLTEDWQRCDRIADVAEIVRSRSSTIDWTALLDSCRRHGCERLVLLGLHLAKELFLVRLPDSVEARLQSHRKAIAKAGYETNAFLHFVITSTDRRQGLDGWRFMLRVRESQWARVPYYQSLAYSLFKPKADDAAWLRASRHVLYAVLRLPLLAVKHGLRALGHANLRESGRP